MAELTIAKSLNKAYRQVGVDKQPFDRFKQQLRLFYGQISSIDTEEKVKGDLMDFLKLTFYGQTYKVSPNGKIDCAKAKQKNLVRPGRGKLRHSSVFYKAFIYNRLCKSSYAVLHRRICIMH